MGVPLPNTSLRTAVHKDIHSSIPDDCYLLCDGKFFRKNNNDEMAELKQLLSDNESLDVSTETNVNMYIKSICMGRFIDIAFEVECTSSVAQVISEFYSALDEDDKRIPVDELQLAKLSDVLSEDTILLDIYNPHIDRYKMQIEQKGSESFSE
ncbi:hypothetical protein BX667DRAFT_186099 [Coemansia mojavensis]|nr:hypothetical protein BX667DRAFT_186099 [Coemansia mojavensis]